MIGIYQAFRIPTRSIDVDCSLIGIDPPSETAPLSIDSAILACTLLRRSLGEVRSTTKSGQRYMNRAFALGELPKPAAVNPGGVGSARSQVGKEEFGIRIEGPAAAIALGPKVEVAGEVAVAWKSRLRLVA